jgi:CheY-like chemotaxis protein
MAPPPPDVLLIVGEWPLRALLRAQLIEDGLDVHATNEWSEAQQLLQHDLNPRLVIVDLKQLPDPDAVEGGRG